ncbi:MAG: hypothetical protein Q4F12_01110 [Erysipelotrichaceae bacterium]|nr:hypothetical protein [Erysipelotrichaceae bacterium]
MKNSFKYLLKNIIRATIGLMICSIGIYLGLVADVGLVPWDSLTMGLANLTSISYGKINISISLTILVIDIILKERVGIGTILDALLTGTFIDILYIVLPITKPGSIIVGLIYLTVGMFIIAFGTSVYMKAGLSCGPRDSLLVAIGKKFPKLKIGYVDMIIKVLLIIISIIIKGPVGIGTVYGMLMMGVCFNIVFGLIKFEPRSITHDDLLDTARRLQS